MPSASEAIAAQLAAGPVRIEGAGTKDWGRPIDAPVLRTAPLDDFRHDAGDFTAVIGAGVSLASAQSTLAEYEQMLALDPPGDATVGGVFATGDSGPLRHRYGAPRDLIIGATLALSDGTLARSGGRVIKNVAGYDLPKLAAGSFGTLGVITEVCVRLHPKPSGKATTVFESDDPATLQKLAVDLAGRPLEAESLDIRWGPEGGSVLARFGGSRATERAAALDGTVVEDDDALWEAQRTGQRGALVVRVAGLPTSLALVLETARELGATAVGRAGVGTTWLTLPPGTDIAALRARLPHPVVLTDAPAEVRAAIDPWGIPDGPELDLMRRVKQRFDPARHCNPGVFL
ncbi:MAG: glycolate oxidase binding subunit [Solirubrobacteraceae bacterium]|nr:glycolate oxidase binding subunit [Solirubrobacteraceae bacterium]